MPPFCTAKLIQHPHFVATKLAAMATSRLCCSSSSSLLLPRTSSSHLHRPAASSFIRLPSLSNGICSFGGRTTTNTTTTTPLHIAHAKIAKGPERKGVTTSATEPEMTPEEKKAYDEISARLEGIDTDFWEGPQFNALGFTIQYLWVFGIVVSIVACIVAVRTYNYGATDFKNTAVFKEALETQAGDFIDDSSEPSVFDESSKVAPEP